MRSIALIGMPGSGKTTVGRALALELGFYFVDCDAELERRTGVRVATIFELEGEAGFRQRETALLAELALLERSVLSTGGGVVLREVNRAVLKEHCACVYLRASLDDLVERTKQDHARPLLRTADPAKRLAELFEVREPLYRQLATLSVDTSNRKPARRLATQIALHLRSCELPF